MSIEIIGSDSNKVNIEETEIVKGIINYCANQLSHEELVANKRLKFKLNLTNSNI